MPDIDEIDFFNRQGNLSVVFLNTEFKRDPDIQRMYQKPRFASKKHKAHVFHQSHHANALRYMCEKFEGGPVTWNPASRFDDPPPVGTVIYDIENPPFLYYHAPTSKTNRHARIAVWDEPDRASLLNMSPLTKQLLKIYRTGHPAPVEQNLEQMFTTCLGCNMIMTQQADFRYITGFGAAGRLNTHGGIIQGRPILQYPADTAQASLEDAYDHWTVANYDAGSIQARPLRNGQDGDDPHIAYYLHLCYPHRDANGETMFDRRILDDAMKKSVKCLFFEQCWVILEIACMATLVEEGKVTEPGHLRSHGMHQHLGVLDFYVSFFLWRLVQFEHGRAIRRVGLDFVQWHQKYYWDAINCKKLFRPNARTRILGQHAYGATAQSGRGLVEQICEELITLYRKTLKPLIKFISGQEGVPPEVSQYFVPPNILRALQARSRQVYSIYFFRGNTFLDVFFSQMVSTDFQSALGKFGINALLFRIIRLCQDYPNSFRRQLLDFRVNWQWLEIERIQLSSKGLDALAAYRLYHLSCLLNSPNRLPADKEAVDAVFLNTDFCSPWTSVLALDAIGSLRDAPFLAD
jgi:hypothetical protein